MAHMHHVRACVPCAPRVYPRCARTSGLRSVCPRCARLRARTVCTVCLCSLSSTCACSSPCLLRVPMLCVLELCAFVLDVWCCTGALVQRSPRSCGLSLADVVDIAGVRRSVLCAGAVHACVVRACASHAPVACTCCACACCACLRCSRLRFPCSRCVHLDHTCCARACCACPRCVHLRAGCGACIPYMSDIRSPLPPPRHQPRCALYPLPPHSLHAHFVIYALMPNHWSHSLDSGSFT